MEQPAATTASAVDTSAMETPALAALVAAGELPRLAERIPDEPLGLGLCAPVTSLGVPLIEARNVQTVGINPWLILPVFAVIVTVLAYNFLGDGLRDAADPYR